MTNRRFRGWAASIAVLALMVAACSSGSSQSTKKAGAKAHEGVSVNVLTFTGPQIAEPLQRRAPDFQRLTGAKIKVVTVPFSELYDKKDLNGDGKADYGSCIAKKRSAQSYWMFLAIAGSFLQTQGTSQGSFFDNETMKPLVNNPAFAAALDVYKRTTPYGPPGELN